MNSRLDSQGPKIAIIGVGKVGAAAAYSIIHRHIASELLLLDARADMLGAQVADLRDATSFELSPRIRAATWRECGQADVIVFTAGTNQKPGQSRLALLRQNAAVVRGGLERMAPLRRDAVLVVVTNPVDAMTYVAVRHAGLPAAQVVGSGTILDSTRLRDAVAQRARVAPRAVSAYVLGEHGDSQTIAWSSAAIGGLPIDQVLPLDADERHEIARFVRCKADDINKVKGETSFGIGAGISSICASIVLDERLVLPLSHYHAEKDMCYSSPAVLGRRGIVRTLDLVLDEDEQSSVDRSVAKLKSVVHSTKSSDSAISSRL